MGTMVASTVLQSAAAAALLQLTALVITKSFFIPIIIIITYRAECCWGRCGLRCSLKQMRITIFETIRPST